MEHRIPVSIIEVLVLAKAMAVRVAMIRVSIGAILIILIHPRISITRRGQSNFQTNKTKECYKTTEAVAAQNNNTSVHPKLAMATRAPLSSLSMLNHKLIQQLLQAEWTPMVISDIRIKLVKKV